jgi:hypothetical protein
VVKNSVVDGLDDVYYSNILSRSFWTQCMTVT